MAWKLCVETLGPLSVTTLTSLYIEIRSLTESATLIDLNNVRRWADIIGIPIL